MKRIFFKLFLAALPLLIIFCAYLYLDPFLVLREYSDHVKYTKKHLELNEDFFLTEAFTKNYKQDKYNSFVFGSSKVAVYHGEHLEKLFNNEPTYKFSVAFESLYGIDKKLEYIDKCGLDIKNVIIGIEPELLELTTNSSGHLFRKNPIISGESWWSFQLVNFKDIFDLTFLKSYVSLYNKNGGSPVIPGYDPYNVYEEKINNNIDSFYAAAKKHFYQRDSIQGYFKPVIGAEQKALLSDIKSIFDKHHTNYYIVIHPMYDQKKMDKTDVDFLDSTFDRNRIFDFTGQNEITNDIHNYYEESHYRKPVADKIMDSIYNRFHHH